MYRFQVSASTRVGDSIGLVGSIPELGLWDPDKAVPLRTSADRHPLWWVELELDRPPANAAAAAGSPKGDRIEYKYVRFGSDGRVHWEAAGPNRWLPIESGLPSAPIIVEDGGFGQVQPYPYGYFLHPVAAAAAASENLKIVVVGSSVALGCSAWLLRGWAWHLQQALQQQYGHQVVNLSELGANVSTTIDRFPLVVAPEQPDVVIIALSLGNEGLAYCPPHQRRAVQRRFESGLQQLVKMTRELGAYPILAGLYPHGDYSPDHAWLLRDTRNRMLGGGVPVLDWLAAVENGQGRWQDGLAFDAAHPNAIGHRLMFEAIDLRLFDLSKEALATQKQRPQQKQEVPVYRDDWGFHIFSRDDHSLRFINTTKYAYRILPDWQELQAALRSQARLQPGLYIAKQTQPASPPCFWVQPDGAIETAIEIPPAADLEYSPALQFFSPTLAKTLFYDGQLALLKPDPQGLYVINESDHEYNIHPMWREVRSALKAMPAGVYHDPLNPDAAFRTLMVGPEGLESRVKLAPRSSIFFRYKCSLSEISRVAIVPLGDRCAIRMLLYKMEYDGPAFPFDLTRTTRVSDVADIIKTGFQDMWNPLLLHYDHEARRIYHIKWTGLSFAHEVEDTDDPLHTMQPVYERMRSRYSARSERFWYTIRSCDQVLFVRTGLADRGSIADLVNKLEEQCQGKPFRLVLISPQPSEEFANLPHVLHYSLEFNPDRMYDDLNYWMHCTTIMRNLLESLEVSSQNLFWCPPNPPRTAPS